MYACFDCDYFNKLLHIIRNFDIKTPKTKERKTERNSREIIKLSIHICRFLHYKCLSLSGLQLPFVLPV